MVKDKVTKTVLEYHTQTYWAFLQTHGKSKLTERKLRLAACALCRLYLHTVKERPSAVAAVIIAENYTDGCERADIVATRCQTAWDTFTLGDSFFGNTFAACARCACVLGKAALGCRDWLDNFNTIIANLLSDHVITFERLGRSKRTTLRVRQEDDRMLGILKAVFGDSPKDVSYPAISKHWLTWRDGIVGQTAESIYKTCEWEELKVLADMLEEAGCSDCTILKSLRGPGPFCKGYWVLDLLLGKA